MTKAIILKFIGVLLNVTAYIVPKYSVKKSFEIFCTPARLNLKPEQISFLNTAVNEDMIMSDGQRIRTYKWGNGPKKVLFSHGWQSHSFRWIKYINELQKNDHYTIYAFDAAAHGQSSGKLLNMPLYSQYIEEFIERYGEMDYHVGHSMGGFAILYTFFRLQDLKPTGIVILASPGNVTEYVDYYRGLLNMNNKSYQLLLQYFQDLFKYDPDLFRSDLFAKKINSRGLIIHDKGDLETSYAHAELLHKSWKHSALHTTEGLGHKLRSDDVVDKVIAFINEA